MAFHGKQTKGARARLRTQKRTEAEQRQANTQHDRTRAHRLGKCECD